MIQRKFCHLINGKPGTGMKLYDGTNKGVIKCPGNSLNDGNCYRFHFQTALPLNNK